jgi:hypothetical protein
MTHMLPLRCSYTVMLGLIAGQSQPLLRGVIGVTFIPDMLNAKCLSAF